MKFIQKEPHPLSTPNRGNQSPKKEDHTDEHQGLNTRLVSLLDTRAWVLWHLGKTHPLWMKASSEKQTTTEKCVLSNLDLNMNHGQNEILYVHFYRWTL